MAIPKSVLVVGLDPALIDFSKPGYAPGMSSEKVFAGIKSSEEELARLAGPEKLSYASQGAGSTAHLSASQLEVLAGIKMVHVPYRGAQPALTDVLAGHVDMFFDTLTTSVPLYRENKVRVLAIADLDRASAVPEIPTFTEAGLPGFRSITWFGLVAPPNTPAALGERINRDVVEILKSAEVSGKLKEMSLDVSATTRAETARFFAEETALWSRVIKQAGIVPQ